MNPPPFRRASRVPDPPTGSGDIGTDQAGGGQLLDQSRPPIWAVIDAQPDAGLNAYGFTRVNDGTGDGTFPDLAGTTETSDGDTLSGNLVAWEVNGCTDVATDGTVKVQLTPNRLGRGYTFTAPGGGGGSAVGSGGSWVAGLTEDDCLALTVTVVAGRCADIDDAQELTLVYNAGLWESDADFDYDGGSGPAVFTLTTGGPKLTIGGVAGVAAGGGAGYIDFAFGGPILCDGTPEACGGNTFTVRLACVECPLRPGFTRTDNSAIQASSLCNKLFGTGNGYTGPAGSVLTVATAADLDECDVYVYFFDLFYNTTDSYKLADADVAAWVASGGRLLLFPTTLNTGGHPGATYITRVNSTLSAVGAAIQLVGAADPVGSSGTCGYPTIAASIPLTAGHTPLTYTNNSSCTLTGGTTVLTMTSGGHIIMAAEQVGSGYIVVASPAVWGFRSDPSCLSELDMARTFRDAAGLL